MAYYMTTDSENPKMTVLNVANEVDFMDSTYFPIPFLMQVKELLLELIIQILVPRALRSKLQE